MSVAGRKLTIRMPDNHRLRGAEVVGIHVDPGSRVRQGSPVMTVQTSEGEQRIRAPRSGRAVPLVTVGDEVRSGDPLFILNLDEHALSDAKSQSRRTMLGTGVEAFTTAKREGMAAEPRMPSSKDRWAYDGTGEAAMPWLKPALAGIVYLIACFALLPVLRQMAPGANATEMVLMVVMAVAVVWIIGLFLMPDGGLWPRLFVRLISVSWLVLAGVIMVPHLLNRPIHFGDSYGPDSAVSGFGGNETAARPVTDGTDPVPVPMAVTRSGVHVGLSDLVPMPKWMQPAPIPAPTDRVTAHWVTIQTWERVLPDRVAGDALTVVPEGKLPATGEVPQVVAEAKAVMALAIPAGLPGNLADPNSKALIAIAEAAPDKAGFVGTIVQSAPELQAPRADASGTAPSVDRSLARTEAPIPFEATARNHVGPVAASTVARIAVAESRASTLDPVTLNDGVALETRIEMAEVSRGAVQSLLSYRAADPVYSALRRGPDDLAPRKSDPDERLASGEPAPTEDSTVIAARDTLARPAGATDVAPERADTLASGGAAGVTILPTDGLLTPSDQLELTYPKPRNAMSVPARADAVSALENDRETDPLVTVRRRLIAERGAVTELTAEATLSEAGQVGASDARAVGRAPITDLPAKAEPSQTVVIARMPADTSPVSIARASRLAWSAAPDEAVPQSIELNDLPGRGESTPLPPKAGSPDPIMIAAVRAGETGWMYAQARRADGERALASGVVPGAERPVEVGGKDVVWRRDRLANVGEVNASADLILSDGAAVSPVAVLEGDLRARAGDASPVTGGETNPLPKLAAISPEIRADDAPASIPKLPSVGPEPATRVLLFVYVDDPRQARRPEKGDDWSAELPAGIESAVWSSRVTGVTEIVQVQNWCDGGSGEAGQAWLSDKIRLLQVRVDIDPARVADFERALPVFGKQPGGFFHNRLPLLGGQPGDPIVGRATAFLREMSGGLFFDEADGVASAMKKAGCSSTVWNGGAGPSTSLGNQLAARFGS